MLNYTGKILVYSEKFQRQNIAIPISHSGFAKWGTKLSIYLFCSMVYVPNYLFSPTFDFHLWEFKEFMVWCIWCGTVPHVRDGDLNSMIEVCAKNNWLLYCRTAQILCVSQHVIWVYKMPVVQSALLLCSGKLSFLLAGSCVCIKQPGGS